MRRITSLALCACLLAIVAFAAGATADPGEEHADDIPPPQPTQPATPPGQQGMELLDVEDKDTGGPANEPTTNSDIAFYGDLAYVGHYWGFRIIDISNPDDMQVLSDVTCRANQGDVSVFQGDDGHRYMLQSIDRPVDDDDCSAQDTPVVVEDEDGHPVQRRRFGYEGLRLFDVTDPANPDYLRFYRTECGSHTHTVVPDPKNGQIHAYVASYPLTVNITPKVDEAEANRRGLNCDAPHQKISIVSMPLDDPSAGRVHKKALSSDSEAYDNDGPQGHGPPFISCHDFQAFLPRDIMVASCAGDAQYWSIKDRGNPSSADGEKHTHIQREVRQDDPSTPENERWESFDFMHNATVSWDGKFAALVDESGGGGEPRCDGGNSRRGFTWFYPLVNPGQRVNGFNELGRYMIPRPQGSEICVSHNGNVLPTTNGRHWQVQAFYRGGNSWLDFTDPSSPAELGFADLEDAVGKADSWSSYWYNDVMYVNGGLGREGPTGNRGFEAYALFRPNGSRVETRDWEWLNPQTQEEWQVPKK
jgi:LVIVD repeat-containing protein